jgi:hypothetical protein
MWKKQLRLLEQNKQWDEAIALLEEVLAGNSDDLDAYICLNYLLINVLIEEDFDDAKHDFYARTAKQTFVDSCHKFHNNAEYLFFTAITCYIAEYYYDIDYAQVQWMIKRALELEPENILYKWGYYLYLHQNDREHGKKGLPYAHVILDKDSQMHKYLESKGAIGFYILDIMQNSMKELSN